MSNCRCSVRCHPNSIAWSRRNKKKTFLILASNDDSMDFINLLTNIFGKFTFPFSSQSLSFSWSILYQCKLIETKSKNRVSRHNCFSFVDIRSPNLVGEKCTVYFNFFSPFRDEISDYHRQHDGRHTVYDSTIRLTFHHTQHCFQHIENYNKYTINEWMCLSVCAIIINE